MRKSVKAIVAGIVLATAAATAGSASAATNLIVNGGFVGGIPNGFTTVGVSSGVIPGWDVLAGTVDWINGYWPSSDGDGFSIDLNGNNHGKIGQTVATVIGQTYFLTFDISANKDLFGTRVAIVGANSDVIGTETYTYNGGPISYDARSISFVANSTSTTISFESGDGINNCCWGAAIDNVGLTAVPEPGAWALMIMGFGGAGAMLRRRREAVA